MSLYTEIQPVKIGKVSYQGRQNLTLFRNLVSLILSCNCKKCLIVTIIVQKFDFEEAWSKLEPKKCCQRQSWAKCMRQILVFM